jgi:hypothetical protein
LRELEEEDEKDLCDLWDMSVNLNVCKFLEEHNSLQIFESLLERFINVYPRAVEILIGIMVNMITLSDDIRLKSLNDESFLVNYLLIEIFANQTDVQSMVQVLMFFNVILSDLESDKKIQARDRLVGLLIKSNGDIIEIIVKKISFIFEQSLNTTLLDCTCSFMSNLFDSSEVLIQIVLAQESNLIESVCNAALTRIDLEKSNENDSIDREEDAEDLNVVNKFLYKYLLCLYTASTCEFGVIELKDSHDSLIRLLDNYMRILSKTINEWEVKNNQSMQTHILGLSMQNFLYSISILNVLIVEKQDLDEIMFKYENLFKNFLNLSLAYLKINDFDDATSLKLIQRNLSEILATISELKNSSQQQRNLSDLMANCLKILNDNQ